MVTADYSKVPRLQVHIVPQVARPVNCIRVLPSSRLSSFLSYQTATSAPLGLCSFISSIHCKGQTRHKIQPNGDFRIVFCPYSSSLLNFHIRLYPRQLPDRLLGIRSGPCLIHLQTSVPEAAGGNGYQRASERQRPVRHRRRQRAHRLAKAPRLRCLMYRYHTLSGTSRNDHSSTLASYHPNPTIPDSTSIDTFHPTIVHTLTDTSRIIAMTQKR
ncbi:hypothetical protein AUP68_04934 [Ilyonectria robusta]